MHPEELETLFDQHAAGYDEQWARMAPIRDGLHLLLEAAFSYLPANARVLCVGAGTGNEIIYLGRRFPQWHFTAVDPSGPMLEICRFRAKEHGILSRCAFHKGYLDTLAPSEPFDAATSILVSQFILEPAVRSGFFHIIGKRLRPGGYLATADLAADTDCATYENLLELWLRMMKSVNVTSEMLERLRAAYRQDIAILPPERVGAIIVSGGFETPIRFFQAGLIHAWYCASTTAVA